MKYFKILIPLICGIFVYLLPIPDGLTHPTWVYFSIFVGLIIGLILEPVPPAFVGMIALVLAIVFKVGPSGSGDPQSVISASEAIKWGLSGFANPVVWLIFSAFSIGLGFSKTGLGERIAFLLVSKLGKSSLGLGYAIAIVDLILAPFIPSNAARSGGTIFPIVTSVAPMFQSLASQNPRKIGSYLVWVGLSSSCVTSSIFLTGQAPNPLALSLVAQNGIEVVDWMGWFLAFLPMGMILFILTPLLAYWIYPPEVKGSLEISIWAREKYQALGKMPLKQIYMILIALVGLVLWIGASFFGINPTTTALIVVVLMVSLGVITWEDFLSNKAAWGTLVWFASLVTMAGGIKNVGFLDYLTQILGSSLIGLSPLVSMILLLLLFSWLRYFFASGTAYVTAVIAIFTTFVSAIPELNPAEVMLILLLPMGFMGIITPYGTGCSPLWFGSGYIKGPQFFLLGGIFAFIYLALYIVIGIPWVKFIFSHLVLH